MIAYILRAMTILTLYLLGCSLALGSATAAWVDQSDRQP